MANTNRPEDLLTMIRDLQREVADLRKRAPLGNAVISRGGLEVQDASGTTLFRVGELTANGEPAQGVAMYRTDGSIQFWAYSLVDGSGGFWGGWDRQGNTIISDDGVSGQGLATPWLPIPFSDSDAVTPQMTTTSGSFTTLQFAKYAHQHPRIYVLSLIRSSAAGTTGEARVLIGGVQVGSTLSIAANDYAYWEIGPASAPGAHLNYYDIEVQARRTGGAGNIGVRVMGAYGEQS